MAALNSAPNLRHDFSSDVFQGGFDLLRGRHFSLVLYRGRRILLTTRTAEAFQTALDLEQSTAEFARAMPSESRRGIRHLMDMRAGPVRVHPALDPAFARFRRETEVGFACSAILIGSPLGRVRATRLAAPAQLPMALVGSVEEALEFFASHAAQP